MKKYIALFSFVAIAVMAVALTSSAATCNISGNEGDDYFATCTSKSTRKFKVDVNSDVDFTSTTINIANSGANAMTAGEDLENGSIDTGDTSATSEASYDVASTDIVYMMNDEETVANIQDNTELEDAVIVADAEDTLNEEVTVTTVADVTETDVIVGNSGANVAASGEDNEGTDIKSGDSTTTTKKNWFVGYTRVYRNVPPSP